MTLDSTYNFIFSDFFCFVLWDAGGGIQKFKIIGYRILYPSIFYFWNQVFWI